MLYLPTGNVFCKGLIVEMSEGNDTKTKARVTSKISTDPKHSGAPDTGATRSKFTPAQMPRPTKPKDELGRDRRRKALNRDKTIATPMNEAPEDVPVETDEVETPKVSKEPVLINLVDTPIWRYMIETAIQEHSKRYFRATNRIMGQGTTAKVLLEPAIQYVNNKKMTGDELLAEVDYVYEHDKHKKGAMQITREFFNSQVLPLQARLEETYTGPASYRWSARETILMVMFVYANFLVKNYNRDTKFMI